MILNRKQFQEWGRIGGRMRAARLSKARRKEIATAAVNAREEYKNQTSKVDVKSAIALFKAGSTLAEIGTEYGVSRQRIHQLLTKAGIDMSLGGAARRSDLRKLSGVEARQLKRSEKVRKHEEVFGCSYDRIIEINGKPFTYSPGERYKSVAGKYLSQKLAAKARGIGWELSLSQWWIIWDESGKWAMRGKGQGYCMARVGDTGSYAVGNVEIKTIGENFSESYYKHPAADRAIKRRQRRAA